MRSSSSIVLLFCSTLFFVPNSACSPTNARGENILDGDDTPQGDQGVGGDTHTGDSDTGDFDMGDDIVPGDDDIAACDPITECISPKCQFASSCAFDAADAAVCVFENLADDSICDFGDATPGSGGGVCRSGVCLEPLPQTCTDNGECSEGLTCLGGTCSEPGGLYDTCDADDDADCDTSLACGPANTCLVSNGAPCTDNAQCESSCIASVCAALSGQDAPCDNGDDSDCDTGLVCSTDDVCRAGAGSSCLGNDECAQTCVGGVCAAPGGLGDACDSGDAQDCSVGACISGVCASGVNGDVFIIEVFDHIAYNCATLSEIEFYDTGDNLLAADTTDTDIYDSARDGASAYWINGNWSRSRLFDGNIAYATVTQGRASSTIMNHDSNPGDGDWTRFAVFLTDGPADISRIRIAMGSFEGRIPMEVKVYLAPSYDFATHIAARQDTGLSLLWTITPTDSGEWYVTDWQEISF